MYKNNKTLLLIILACLTLGLAPFTPEPHLWGKLKWLAGGANGMQLIDYWDTLMHGAPFLMLFYWLIRMLIAKTKKEQQINNR